MARGDLLIALVRAGTAGDKKAVRTTAEAIIAEERAKQHNVLADRLTMALQAKGNGTRAPVGLPETAMHGQEFIVATSPRRRLDDLILPRLGRRAVDTLVEEQQRASLLRAHGIDPRHRILLVGPPGNGKTSLAEAIAEALAIPFFVVRYEAIIGSYLGETASRLKRIFDYARTTPCVLFFDEFDALAKERGDIHETGEIKRVVISLLMQVDDLPSYTIIIAATNHPELLDRAVWRRFQLRLELPMPTRNELTRYFERFIKALSEKPGISASTLAKRMGSVSYSEAEQFTMDVRRQAILEMKSRPLKGIIEDQMRLWKAQEKLISEEGGYGGTSAAGPASTD